MNPIVEYINSLRTQSHDADPNYVEENRAESLARLRVNHPWFPADEVLRVPTHISVLIEAMRRPDFPADLVFLTGDAGDGKTAACVDLAASEDVRRPLKPVDRAGNWIVIKDASEIGEPELLAAISASRRDHTRLVVAINEGRLRRLQRTSELKDLWSSVFTPSLASWIDNTAAGALDAAVREHRVVVVNFRHRMHVRPVTPALLEVWTRKEFWENGAGCGSCSAQAQCPILANAQSLRRGAVVQRLTDALALAHYAGQRLPFRRLQGVLAHAVTAGLRCAQVISGRRPQLTDRYYWVFLQREPTADSRPEPVARALAPIDPAFVAEPRRDEVVSSLMRDTSSLEAFDRLALEGSENRESTDNMRALRRRLTFDSKGPISPDSASDTWLRALEIVENAAVRGDDKLALEVLAEGINRLHRHETTLQDAITDHQLEPAAFRDPERASLEVDVGTQFEFRLAKGPVLPPLVRPWLESAPTDLELQAWPRHQPRPTKPARMRVDARLIVALLDVRRGFTFIPAVGSHRRELARFHAQLIEQVDVRNIHVVLRSEGRAWRLTHSGNQLRFEGRN